MKSRLSGTFDKFGNTEKSQRVMIPRKKEDIRKIRWYRGIPKNHQIWDNMILTVATFLFPDPNATKTRPQNQSKNQIFFGRPPD